MAINRTESETATSCVSTPAAGRCECIEEQPVQSWEQIEPGRYMPRRTRGSLRGRELG